MALSQDFLDITIGNVQTLHGRFGNELCNILKRHTGDSGIYSELVSINNVVGKIKDILYDYVPVGNTTINDLNNNLTETEIMSLINYTYKVLNKYNSNVFLPTNPNVYL
jgi:hypothetical protein